MSAVIVSDANSKSLTDEFDRIFREHYQLIYRTAFGVTGSAEDAEDVLQTIFLRLLRRDLPPDLKQNPKAYMYRAAVNVSLSTIRRRQRQVLTDKAELFEMTDDTGSNSPEDLHRRLYAAIAELEPASAQAVILRYIHNYSNPEIARLLGTSQGTIAVRLFRSRIQLRKIVRAQGGDK